MSLYNMLHGFDPNYIELMFMLEFLHVVSEEHLAGGPWRAGRFRDIHLHPDGDKIWLLTRNGGGNREHYWPEDAPATKFGPPGPGDWCPCPGCTIKWHIPQHPEYVRDWDDEWDSTFAWVEFKVPEKYKARAKQLLPVPPILNMKQLNDVAL